MVFRHGLGLIVLMSMGVGGAWVGIVSAAGDGEETVPAFYSLRRETTSFSWRLAGPRVITGNVRLVEGDGPATFTLESGLYLLHARHASVWRNSQQLAAPLSDVWYMLHVTPYAAAVYPPSPDYTLRLGIYENGFCRGNYSRSESLQIVGFNHPSLYFYTSDEHCLLPGIQYHFSLSASISSSSYAFDVASTPTQSEVATDASPQEAGQVNGSSPQEFTPTTSDPIPMSCLVAIEAIYKSPSGKKTWFSTISDDYIGSKSATIEAAVSGPPLPFLSPCRMFSAY
jgi:hypothetical protein